MFVTLIYLLLIHNIFNNNLYCESYAKISLSLGAVSQSILLENGGGGFMPKIN